MNIAKALKVKNRLVGDINRLWAIIHKRNTLAFIDDGLLNQADKGQQVQESVNARDAELTQVTEELDLKLDELIKLKTAIQVATLPIAHKLVELSELKSFISKWETLNPSPMTRLHVNHYGDDSASEQVLYDFFKYDDVQTELKRLRKLAEDLQDDIDDHNGKTEVAL